MQNVEDEVHQTKKKMHQRQYTSEIGNISQNVGLVDQKVDDLVGEIKEAFGTRAETSNEFVSKKEMESIKDELEMRYQVALENAIKTLHMDFLLQNDAMKVANEAEKKRHHNW